MTEALRTGTLERAFMLLAPGSGGHHPQGVECPGWAEDRDQRIHGTTFTRPADRWAADVAGAAPYDPTRLWAFGEQWDRKVTGDVFVHWEGHRFAVPWESAGHVVQVRRTAPDGIEIRQDQRILARYPLPTEPQVALVDDYGKCWTENWRGHAVCARHSPFTDTPHNAGMHGG